MNHPKLVYNPSRIKLLVRRLLYVCQNKLPGPIYKVFYNIGFATYNILLRSLYLRFVVYYRLLGGEEDYEKALAIFRMMPYSLVGSSGLSATYDIARSVENENLEGAFVECGVARGGSAALMALVAAQAGNHRGIWLFDSFEGLPEPTSNDFAEGSTGIHVRPLPKGSCLGMYEEVEGLLFSKLRLDRNDIKLVKGWFQDTLPVYCGKIGAISVLRIDGDWYESTKCCLDNLYDNVVKGGYVIVDDYGSCYGAQKATDELLAARALSVELVFDGRGGCHFVKPHQ